ncbi:fimbrial protein [Pseudescherichia vulneris]
MINCLIQKATTLKIPALLLFIFFSSTANARDCEFEGNFNPTINVNESVPITFLPRTSNATQLKQWTYLTDTYSNCHPGDDGNDLFSKRSTDFYPPTDINGVALFDTNVKGIFYSIEIGANGGSARSALFSSRASEHHQPLDEYQVQGKRWNVIITLYQRPEYDGIPSGIKSINLKRTGYAGYFRVGGAQHKSMNITMASMNVPVVVPTCTSLVSSAGTGSVDLGRNYEIDDVKNNKTKQVGFTITASQCSNVLRFRTKLTANSAYKGLLTNNSAESLRAGGVGVKIWAPNGAQLLANDSQSVYTEAPATMQWSKTFNYKAQLVTSGNGGVTTGDFKATGTFSMSYE